MMTQENLSLNKRIDRLIDAITTRGTELDKLSESLKNEQSTKSKMKLTVKAIESTIKELKVKAEMEKETEDWDVVTRINEKTSSLFDFSKIPDGKLKFFELPPSTV